MLTGHPMWLACRAYIAFFVGPELEAWTKTREADSHLPSLGCFGPIATEVVLWIPELIAAEFYCHIWSGHCPFIYSVSQSIYILNSCQAIFVYPYLNMN